jgi:uncharacterized protein (DUF934 family)
VGDVARDLLHQLELCGVTAFALDRLDFDHLDRRWEGAGRLERFAERNADVQGCVAWRGRAEHDPNEQALVVLDDLVLPNGSDP